MLASELRQKTEQELKELLEKQKKDYRSLVEDISKQKEKNVHKPKQLRREIARTMTVLNERKILAESEAQNE
jgi:ribosomal protein L29